MQKREGELCIAILAYGEALLDLNERCISQGVTENESFPFQRHAGHVKPAPLCSKFLIGSAASSWPRGLHSSVKAKDVAWSLRVLFRKAPWHEVVVTAVVPHSVSRWPADNFVGSKDKDNPE